MSSVSHPGARFGSLALVRPPAKFENELWDAALREMRDLGDVLDGA